MKKVIGGGANNLALLNHENIKNYKEAIKWYEIAIKHENTDALKNLGYMYHINLKDDVNSAQYYIALINNGFSKKQVLKFLKNEYGFSDKTIKKGYELQLNSKIIPEKLKYKGGI